MFRMKIAVLAPVAFAAFAAFAVAAPGCADDSRAASRGGLDAGRDAASLDAPTTRVDGGRGSGGAPGGARGDGGAQSEGDGPRPGTGGTGAAGKPTEGTGGTPGGPDAGCEPMDVP